jgi:polysaccharide biosynthesis transport protein
MSPSQLLIIFKARWRIMLAVFLAVVLTVLAGILIMPKKYTASASVLVDVKSPDPIAGMVFPAMLAPGYMATQMDLIQSERVARGAVRALRLTENTAMREQWQETTKGVGSFEAWLASLLQAGLEVRPSRESSVISFSYEAVDPNFAAAIANAFVQSYINTTLELRIEPARQYGALFETQAKLARDRLEAAQNRLSAYQQEKGIIATDERLDVENARLNELSSQLVAVQTMSAEASSRKAKSSSSSQEVLNNPVVSSLKAEMSRQEARLKELNSRLGSAHPQVIEAQASIGELRDRIAAEAGRVNTSVAINSAVSQQREAQIREALEQQREKVLKMKEQRDEASVLLRDVESAQRTYENINARLSQVAIEGQSNQTNVSIIKQAMPPTQPSSPRIMVNMVLAVLAGGMLAVIVGLLLEIRDRRLRTDFDVTELLELPVLGSIPTRNKPEPRALPWRKKTATDTESRTLPELTAPRS